jgi:hypothetical protein
MEKNINHVSFGMNGCNPGPKNGTNELEVLRFELLDLMRGLAVVAILVLATIAELCLEASYPATWDDSAHDH